MDSGRWLGRSILRRVEDGNDDDLIGRLIYLVHENIGQTGQDPFPCAGVGAWTADLLKMRDAARSRLQSGRYPFGGGFITVPDIAQDVADLANRLG